MKTKTTISLCLLIPLLSSCTFFAKHQATLAFIAHEAAMLGTQLWLANHPGDRPIFVASAVALTRLLDSGSGDPKAFADALKNLPINELKGSGGSIYISAVIVIWDELANVADPVTQQAQVQAIARAVYDGMEAALGGQTALWIESKGTTFPRRKP